MKVMFLFPVIDTVAMQYTWFTIDKQTDVKVTQNKQMKSTSQNTLEEDKSEPHKMICSLAGGDNIINLRPGTKSNSHNNNNNGHSTDKDNNNNNNNSPNDNSIDKDSGLAVKVASDKESRC